MARKVKRGRYKYGSAPTLDGIREVIQAFYCGERKNVEPAAREENTWHVFRANGEMLAGVCVRKVRGRFYFESIS